MQARDYQQQCCDAILDATAKGFKAILCVLFTGAGKTVIFSLLAKMLFNSKILIIAPMRELVWQAADTADRITEEYTDVEMAGSWASGNRVTVACRNTLLAGKEKRYKRLLGVRLVIVDEAHTQFSEPFLAMLQEFIDHGAIVIGFTATPFRMDGKPLMKFYQHVAFDYGLQQGIRDGWCAPPRARIVQCTDLDLSKVKVTGGDYSASDLEMVIGVSSRLHQFCLTIQRERVGAAIAFLPGVASARALAEMAERIYGIKAAWICGNEYLQPQDERNRIINQYRAGEIDLLCNCQIATMGFDAPLTRTIFMFRPTKSRTLAMQIWGRATRPLPGVVDACENTPEARIAAIAASEKPWFKIVDVTDSVSNHSIRTSVDMFADEGTDKAVLEAARRRAADEDADAEGPEDLLAQAADDVRKAKLIEAGLKAMEGQAGGKVHGRDILLDGSRKKDISEYRVPLRGRYAGRTMAEVDDDYIEWALKSRHIAGWQKGYFAREKARRRSLGGHPGRDRSVVQAG